MLVYYDLNSNLLRIQRLKNERTGAYVSAGVTVSADIVPAGTSSVVTGSAISLTYDGPDGIWSGVYDYTLPVSVGVAYEVRLTIDGGAPTSRGYLTAPMRVLPRRA